MSVVTDNVRDKAKAIVKLFDYLEEKHKDETGGYFQTVGVSSVTPADGALAPWDRIDEQLPHRPYTMRQVMQRYLSGLSQQRKDRIQDLVTNGFEANVKVDVINKGEAWIVRFEMIDAGQLKTLRVRVDDWFNRNFDDTGTIEDAPTPKQTPEERELVVEEDFVEQDL